MSEAITSFLDNIKQKTTNPFFGTLILVYLYRNWELVYSLFTFDKECTHADKLSYIYNYLHTNSDKVNLACNIGFALLVYLIGLALLVISRFCIDIKDERLTKWIHKKTIPEKIATKEDYEEMKKQRDSFFTDLVNERERFSTIEIDNKNLRVTISENSEAYNRLNTNYQDLVTQNERTSESNREKDSQISRLEDEIKQKQKTIDIDDIKIAELNNFVVTKKIQIAQIFDNNIILNEDTLRFFSNSFNKEEKLSFLKFVDKCLKSTLAKEDFNQNEITKYLALGLVGINNEGISNGQFIESIYITSLGISIFNHYNKDV